MDTMLSAEEWIRTKSDPRCRCGAPLRQLHCPFGKATEGIVLCSHCGNLLNYRNGEIREMTNADKLRMQAGPNAERNRKEQENVVRHMIG